MRWKTLNHVAANLFRKLCVKFHHNCTSFVGDITENIFVSFFPDTVYVVYTLNVYRERDIRTDVVRRSLIRVALTCKAVYSTFSTVSTVTVLHIAYSVKPGWVNRTKMGSQKISM